MYSFSKKSLEKLNTADEKLQRLFKEVIKEIDITVIFGHRTPEEQFELFKQGRKFVNNEWVKTGKTVTNLDGINKKSNHNYYPSKAVDIAPYPIDWNDIERFKLLASIIKRKALELGINVQWGGDWQSFKDYPHWEIKE